MGILGSSGGEEFIVLGFVGWLLRWWGVVMLIKNEAL